MPQSGKKITPYSRAKLLCTAILLTNLATAQWLPIRCNERTVSNVVCLQKTDTQAFSGGTTGVNKDICIKFGAKFKNFCLIFLDIQAHTNIFETNSAQKLRKANSSTPLNLVSFLTATFSASSLSSLNYIILHSGNLKVLSLQKRWTTITSSHKLAMRESHVVQVCFTTPRQFLQKHSGFQVCTNGSYISNYFLCNSHTDTGQMVCDKHMLNCSKVCTTRLECQCTPLFFLDRQDRCQSFVSSQKELYNLATKPDSTKHLQHCLSQFSDDKLWKGYLNLQVTNTNHTARFRCDNIANPSDTYTLSDICIYKLDSDKLLLPCKHGSHLQECKHFTCPLHFKCPGYFCTP